MSTFRLIVLVCVAQTLAQIGAFSVPALLPRFITEWDLSNTQGGWITGIFYFGYVASVPLLVALTDRIDPKRVYLFGVGMITIAGFGYAWLADSFSSALVFRAVWGIGWAGTYMPGLKALSDFVEGPSQSRAVTAHAASIGVSGALSFVIAGTIAEWFGWRWGVATGGAGALVAWILMALFLPSRTPKPHEGAWSALFNFRPILRNRSAMAYSIGYCVHTFEMSALRNWVVAFLTFAAAYQGVSEGGLSSWLAPTAVASCMGILGVCSSVTGNEISIRFGRRRLILAAMFAGLIVAGTVGFTTAVSYTLAAVLVLVYAILIWADSSSLTAGAAGSARPGQRGATLAMHSTLGYSGGFFGPLTMGFVLDLTGGGTTPESWGIAFLAVATIMLIGPLAMFILKPEGLAGDK